MFPKKRKVTERIKYPLENFSVEEYFIILLFNFFIIYIYLKNKRFLDSSSKQINNDNIYNLKAISIHQGGANSGHYITLALRNNSVFIFFKKKFYN